MVNLKALRFLPVLLAFCITACEKTIIKDDTLIEDQEGLRFSVTDTMSIYASTIKSYPLRTDNLLPETYSIGRIDDPVFGVSTAAVSASLTLPFNNVDLGSNLTLDSVVMMLRPIQSNNTYGDGDNPVSFVVHEITESIEPGVEYLSDETFSLSSADIGRIDNLIPQLGETDSIEVGGEMKPAHIRIPMDINFWQNVFDQAGTPNMADNAAFRNYLNGIHIKVDEAQSASAMYYFNLVSAFSKVAFFYRDGDGLNQTFDLQISTGSAKVNHFSHDFSGAFIESDIRETVTAPGDSVIYLKSHAGTIGMIELPYIEQFRDKVINKAELIVTVLSDPLDEVNDELYPPSERMNVIGVQEDGTPMIITDQLVSVEYFGGFLNTEEIDGQEYQRYRFNLGRHIQELVKKESLEPHEKYLYLLNFPANRTANRTIIGGTNSAESGLKLKITYTNIE